MPKINQDGTIEISFHASIIFSIKLTEDKFLLNCDNDEIGHWLMELEDNCIEETRKLNSKCYFTGKYSNFKSFEQVEPIVGGFVNVIETSKIFYHNMQFAFHNGALIIDPRQEGNAVTDPFLKLISSLKPKDIERERNSYQQLIKTSKKLLTSFNFSAIIKEKLRKS